MQLFLLQLLANPSCTLNLLKSSFKHQLLTHFETNYANIEDSGGEGKLEQARHKDLQEATLMSLLCVDKSTILGLLLAQ